MINKYLYNFNKIKIGDTLKIRDDLEINSHEFISGVIPEMLKYKGYFVKIYSINPNFNCARIIYNNKVSPWMWDSNMFYDPMFINESIWD